MFRITSVIVGLSLFAVGCGSSPSEPSQETTTTSTFTVPLSPANEVPAVVNADATGRGSAIIAVTVRKDASGTITSATADFQIDVTGFPAGTRVTDAHVHNGGAGANASVFISVGLTSGELALTNGSGTISKKGITVPADRAAAILGNPAGHYFNVHTALNPDGAIRGQLSAAAMVVTPGGPVY